MIPGAFSKLLFIVLTASETMPQSKKRGDLALKEITKANNEFAFLLHSALKSQYPGNLIFSPFSLSAVMAMIRAGANGNTAYAIDRTFKFPKSSDTLNEGYKTLREYFKSIGGEMFWKTANQIYVQAGFELNKDFKRTLKTYYNYEPIQLNFSNANESAYIINDFFDSTTRGQIQKVFTADNIPEVNGIILVNAIYFHGHWENKFDQSLTNKDVFYITPYEHNGFITIETVVVDMMKLEADLKYGDIEELGATVVLLPFKAVSFSMIFLLPHKEDGLPDLEDRLKMYPITEMLSELKLSSVSLWLPRFELESAIDLKLPLSSMGLGVMFDSAKANFSGINPYLFVSKAVQKTFIRVNEEGSVATTTNGIENDPSPTYQPFPPDLSDSSNYRIKLNRPFIAMIYDQPTECVLFFNVINRPNYTKRVTTKKVISENPEQPLRSVPTGIGFCGVSDYDHWDYSHWYQNIVKGTVFYKNNQFWNLETCLWCPMDVNTPLPIDFPKALLKVLYPNQTSFLSISIIILTIILAILAVIFSVAFVTTFFICSKREITANA